MIPLICLSVLSLMATVASAQPVSSGVLTYVAYRQPRQIYTPLKTATNTVKALSKRKLSLDRFEGASSGTKAVSTSDHRPRQETTLFLSKPLLESGEEQPPEELEVSAVKSSPIGNPILARLFRNWRVDATGGLTRPV